MLLKLDDSREIGWTQEKYLKQHPDISPNGERESWGLICLLCLINSIFGLAIDDVFVSTIGSVRCSTFSWLKGERPGTRTLAAWSQKKGRGSSEACFSYCGLQYWPKIARRCRILRTCTSNPFLFFSGLRLSSPALAVLSCWHSR